LRICECVIFLYFKYFVYPYSHMKIGSLGLACLAQNPNFLGSRHLLEQF
jgi:hypothetical protein